MPLENKVVADWWHEIKVENYGSGINKGGLLPLKPTFME